MGGPRHGLGEGGGGPAGRDGAGGGEGHVRRLASPGHRRGDHDRAGRRPAATSPGRRRGRGRLTRGQAGPRAGGDDQGVAGARVVRRPAAAGQ